MRVAPREPRPFVDENGTQCVQLELARQQGQVRLDAVDYARLIADGVSDRWHLNTEPSSLAYVKSYHPERGTVRIAREILGLTKGDGLWARHHNGDALDLRRCNLFAHRRSAPRPVAPIAKKPKPRVGPHPRTAASTPARSPAPFEDEAGVACLRVPVAGSVGPALIERRDYLILTVERGIPPGWCFNSNGSGNGASQVKAHHPERGTLSIAREILGLRRGDGRRVKLLNGNPLDLRRANLAIDEPGRRQFKTQRRTAR